MDRRVVALVGALCFVVLAACGGGNDTGAEAGHAGMTGDGGPGGTGGFWGVGGSGAEGAYAATAGVGASGGLGGSTTGGTGGTGTCAHGVCAQGGPLTPNCDPCVAKVCAQDSFCCQGGWDDLCVQQANSLCGSGCPTTGAGGFGGGSAGGGAVGGSGGAGGSAGACSQTSCWEGCCDANGKCITTTAQSKSSCGRQGAACVDCSTNGSVCNSGHCAECKPNCQGKKCGEPNGCGGLCEGSCPVGQFCGVGKFGSPAACVKCGPGTCSGCCTPDGQCVTGGKRDECGRDGQACQDCGSQACNINLYSFPFKYACGACGASCPLPGPEPSTCQADGCGKLCPGSGCTNGEECTLGSDGTAQCGKSCIVFGCDSGCCDKSGNCVQGNLPSQCGSGALECVDCVAMGGSCDTKSQTCTVCSPNCSVKACGAPDGCGGTCTGKQGATCSFYAGATCNDEGTCECAASGQMICYDATAAKGSCRDTLSDVNNCGGCDIKCPVGSKCTNGSCECPAGSLFCANNTDKTKPGVCTNLATDANHCGTCAKACSGTACADGKCGACAAGTSKCTYPTPGCFNLQSDTKNCGECGNACPSGIACANGACACPSGQTSCNAKCTDTKTDAANCGACGTNCPNGVSCVSGKCQCPAGTTHCNGTCTNTDVDPNNCGKCNTICPGLSCKGGKCL